MTRVPIVVHGHLYQPPREDPWTGETAHEPTAAPFHDWNERITHECYRPNADVNGWNNYERLSFNLAPTLAAWFEQHDPDLLAQIVAADREQLERSGHGG